MRKLWKIAVSAAMFVGFSANSPRIQAESNKQENEVIVVYKNASGKENVIEQADTVEHVYRHIPAAAVTADDKTVRELEQDPDVLYVEDNLPVAAADSTVQKLSPAAQRKPPPRFHSGTSSRFKPHWLGIKV